MAAEIGDSPSPLLSISSVRSGISQTNLSPRPHVNQVGILPSSIPTYHKDFIERAKSGDEQGISTSVPDNYEPPTSRTEAEREEMARRLKPHARAQMRLEEGTKRPQGMTPIAAPKKSKPVRWQFGIRSRNAPWEALLCIHKALHKLGATYVPDEDYSQVHGKGGSEPPSGESSFASSGTEGAPLKRDTGNAADPAKQYKLPADPWHIKVRWETAGKLSTCLFYHNSTIGKVC